MKVLCMAETLGRGGGAEQLIFALAPYFKALGVEVHYLSLFPYADDLGVVMEAQGHRVFRAEIERPWHLLEASRRIRSVVRLEDYDVLWGHLYFGNLYANLLNLGHRSRKVVISLHSEGYAQQAQLGFKDRVITMLEKALCGRADAKYAVSSAVKVDYERFFGWSGLGIIHNGVDVSAIATPLAEGERMAIRRSHGVGEGEFLVVVPARFVKKKGHTYLIRAIRVLMDEGILVKAYFASAQGPERASLEAEIAQLQLHGQITLSDATVPHEALFRLIKASDAGVIPSLREPFGIAAAEAMACGVPTVLTKVDGFMELVGDSGGAWMVEPGDVNGLAAAMRCLVQEPESRAGLGARGFERVRDEFDIGKCAQEWTAAFGRVGRADGLR